MIFLIFPAAIHQTCILLALLLLVATVILLFGKTTTDADIIAAVTDTDTTTSKLYVRLQLLLQQILLHISIIFEIDQKLQEHQLPPTLLLQIWPLLLLLQM